ncbi:aspartyl/glutamyl-tRNA amidotransferase subunit A [Candidatus Woesebacteria bacterium]|nr:aspartyl/glutamyl-tRNA amidotransferase subunit A [Candidatus Woesebacteria bacterium]
MLSALTLKEYLTKVSTKEISPADVVTEIQSSIEQQKPDLNIYLALNPKATEESTSRVALPLAGAPIAVKDNFLTKGIVTTASSKVLDGFVPPYESTVTARLQQAGGVILGKTNMDAWAHGSSTETSDYGPTKNPRNTQHLPGGSSGGSAAAVAANVCIAALGSETAGSIRQPAAWCGIVGLKPTYGRVPRTGVVAMGSSLDCPGPMGKTVEDCAILLNAIAGNDRLDGTSSMESVPDFRTFLLSNEQRSAARPLEGMRIGVAYADFTAIPEDTRQAVEAAAKVYEELGAEILLLPTSEQLEEGKLLSPQHAIGVYTVVQRSEVSSNLARYDGIRYGHPRSDFGDEAKRRIMLGTFTLSKGYADQYYTKAQKVRTLYIQNYNQLFTRVDALISPVSPHFALKLGATKDNPMFGELEDMLVEPSSISGFPGISVPMAKRTNDGKENSNLTLGLNILTPMWQEGVAIKLAHAYTISSTYEADNTSGILNRKYTGSLDMEMIA